MNTTFKPGALVSMHDREWVILPSPDPDIIQLKPLGGTELEIKGVHRLAPDFKAIQPTELPLPNEDDLGDFASAKLLFEAARLSFRSGAGPFRSMGRLSFQPRAYQLVPLIMALRLDTVRLLIADDVGIGKTIEALLIARELYDRGEIKRFTVVCLPHLCDQWVQELKDKFGMQATLIRSSTVKSLERKLGPNQTLFDQFPIQVISIDYIKGERKRELFLNHLPDLVIVDEAHTCSSPGEKRSARSQRHRVVKAISDDPKQHLVLLSATPHSGKPQEFQSILGLLKPEFESLDLSSAGTKEKRKVAEHFVQRRRKNVEKWMDEKTPFPSRDSLETSYSLSASYAQVFRSVLRFARVLATKKKEKKQQFHYYAAISLLRGVMSSPAMGTMMLEKRLNKHAEDSMSDEQWSSDLELTDTQLEQVLDGDFGQNEDQAPIELTEQVEFSRSERQMIKELTQQVTALAGLAHDHKAAKALSILNDWLPTDNTIVFCRYIQTANYLGDVLIPALRKTLGNKLVVEVVTSELSDEERKQRVAELADRTNAHRHKLLIATDCMSEGINLQEQFSAVMHYDLPWNPNRLEQREGRIDRFGQAREEVKTLLLYGDDNPMDGTVLKVLLRKAREIRRATGVAVPFPDDSKSIMDAVLSSVLLKPQTTDTGELQTQLDFGEDSVIRQKVAEVEQSFDRLQEREKQITSVFAQNKIKPGELIPYIHETEQAIGGKDAVCNLLQSALPHYHTTLDPYEKGYRISTTNLPAGLKSLLPSKSLVLCSFESPTPKGYEYIARNHPFVEAVCLHVLDAAIFKGDNPKITRAAVVRSVEVRERTVMYLLRIRNVIENRKGEYELVAEELKLWGFTDHVRKAKEVFNIQQELYKTPSSNVSAAEKLEELNKALAEFKVLKEQLIQLAEQRADYMVEGHEQFRKVVNGDHFNRVEPVLPPDVLGIYILLPQ